MRQTIGIISNPVLVVISPDEKIGPWMCDAALSMLQAQARQTLMIKVTWCASDTSVFTLNAPARQNFINMVGYAFCV